MKTISTPKEAVVRAWHIFDCEGQTLGRLATKLAKLLIGKHKADYTTHTDMGDFVVVINADKIKLTGNKLLDKLYSRHSNFPGGFRQESAGRLMARDSRKVIEHAVSGMLPHNKLHDPRMSRLKIYKDAKHPHEAQFTTKES
jgi:large subunit ribosomal protein L13